MSGRGFLLGQTQPANAGSAGEVPTQTHKSPLISSGMAHSNVILSADQLAFIKWDQLKMCNSFAEREQVLHCKRLNSQVGHLFGLAELLGRCETGHREKAKMLQDCTAKRFFGLFRKRLVAVALDHVPPDSSKGSFSNNFFTWSDSPVKELSSILRSLPWMRTPSAGRRSPDEESIPSQ